MLRVGHTLRVSIVQRVAKRQVSKIGFNTFWVFEPKMGLDFACGICYNGDRMKEKKFILLLIRNTNDYLQNNKHQK